MHKRSIAIYPKRLLYCHLGSSTTLTDREWKITSNDLECAFPRLQR
uniref:Uncharacterized protein n=1 Tax=Anguilla anguilla TaxID=7936 RepID=A0A0E9WHS7_ANGAN